MRQVTEQPLMVFPDHNQEFDGQEAAQIRGSMCVTLGALRRHEPSSQAELGKTCHSRDLGQPQWPGPGQAILVQAALPAMGDSEP